MEDKLEKIILHIAPDYFNTPIYGNLCEALQTQGCMMKQYIYASDNAKYSGCLLPQNISVVDRAFSIFERLLFFPKQRYLLRDVELKIPLNRVQLIHAHTLFSSGYLAYKLHQKYNIPYIVAVRNTDVNIFLKYMPHLRHIGREIVAHAKKIIFISPAYQKLIMRRYFPAYSFSKSIVIPNGIDPIFLNNLSMHKYSKDIIRLIYVGRIENAKNIHTIIKVADFLTQQGKCVKLCLVGKIIDTHYKTIINSRKNYVEWHNQCPKQQVLHYFRNNDIYVMPSFYETFGLTYIEAMSQGLPVIYTKGQGFDGFFKEGEVGYSVSPKDVQDIAKKIIDIYANYAKISNNCIIKSQQFNWQFIADKYNQIYSSVSYEH
jgi:glycosyltransferase involved in cell wall biosynthesis